MMEILETKWTLCGTSMQVWTMALQECYVEHRGGDTSVCTGIVDRKCDPVAICQLAVDNVKGLDGDVTTAVGCWIPPRPKGLRSVAQNPPKFSKII